MTSMDSDSEADRETRGEDCAEDPPDGSDSQHRPDSAFDFVSTYKYYRDFIVESIPLGSVVWDLTRILGTVLIFASVSLLLTGLLTPFVAVSSGSMEPHINTGDMVVLSDHNPENPPPLASNAEITTVAEGHVSDTPHTTFNGYGDVIVFEPANGDVPIIHRAHMWVEEGENWVVKGDSEYLGDVTSCDDIKTCPAPNDGYITAGDNNKLYDQLRNDKPPVEEDRIIGVAEYRVPGVGWIRIGFDAVNPL